MEFDELQKIWHSQTNEPLWVINEKALYKRILVKKAKASHITNFSELLVLIVYAGAGSLIAGLNYVKPKPNLMLYLMAAWMFATALYVLVSRIRRIKGSHAFDRSMLGELNYAVSMATYQVRFSQLMRWNIIPVGILSLWGVWRVDQSVWLVLGIVMVFILGYAGGGWEHRIYIAKKRELEALQRKLMIGL
ncbi:hypothetical protein [Spirosoma foliorum]|uniref:Uncharacterized protein n=1 Tax=Spirosoma foliorum TaxID=2710596 RepID=A0A7G5GPV9_9BACT|nr:hypothetical protein [Spirosoma foliorum]QMW00901.1 hypothetical protein H3H32_23370 [Spirosoma foliorum]